MSEQREINIEKVDAPPSKGGRSIMPNPVLAELMARCEAEPGEWFRASTANKSENSSIVTTLNKTDEFEATGRTSTELGTAEVYARKLVGSSSP